MDNDTGTGRNGETGRDDDTATGRDVDTGTGRDGDIGRDGDTGTGRDSDTATGRDGDIGRDSDTGTGRDVDTGRADKPMLTKLEDCACVRRCGGKSNFCLFRWGE